MMQTTENSGEAKLLRLYRSVRFRLRHSVAEGIKRLPYKRWIRRVEQRGYKPGLIRREIAGFRYQPKISVIMPVFKAPPEILDAAIGSVKKQHYENWELCICDDASPDPRVSKTLEKWQKKHARIKVRVLSRNEGICGASNGALELASGEFVGLLDHDDELSGDALYEVAKLLQEHPEADMIYSDEDKLDAGGHRVEPFFKPDWSPEYLLAVMYTCHFGVYRRGLIEEIGGFRPGFEGSQDYDLALRISEKTERIFHIPKILYHWRMMPNSAAASAEAKPYASIAAKRALSEHLERRGISAEILDGSSPTHYRINFALRGNEEVSIIVVASGQDAPLKRCLSSIEKKRCDVKHEVIVALAEGTEPQTAEFLASRPYRVVRLGAPFASSQLINLSAAEATGEYLLLLRDGTEVISEDWIAAMLGLCAQKEIGVVGAKLLYKDDLIEHAGIVLGLKGIAGRPLQKFPRNTRVGFGRAADLRNCSAVSAECMMVRKDVFIEVGGFDEELSSAYNDVDFCLAVRRASYRVVWTPWVELYHESRVLPENGRAHAEVEHLRKRWGKLLTDDPYYNPNLTLDHENFGFRV
jgi:GT2 family glycosyltransferase